MTVIASSGFGYRAGGEFAQMDAGTAGGVVLRVLFFADQER